LSLFERKYKEAKKTYPFVQGIKLTNRHPCNLQQRNRYSVWTTNCRCEDKDFLNCVRSLSHEERRNTAVLKLLENASYQFKPPMLNLTTEMSS